jgi:broad specificity phosphatase PhoE
MRFTFIRHSLTEFNANVPKICWGLTEEGIKLAKNLARNKVVKSVDVLYSSIETKAIETALYLAKPNKLTIKMDFNLVEVTSITKKIFPDFNKAARDILEGKIEEYIDGETEAEALKRFKDALSDIVAIERKNGKTNIGIVSHGSVYALFTAEYCDLPVWDVFQSIGMPDIAIYEWETQKFTRLWKNLKI